jgi:hypothetical protein
VIKALFAIPANSGIGVRRGNLFRTLEQTRLKGLFDFLGHLGAVVVAESRTTGAKTSLPVENPASIQVIYRHLVVSQKSKFGGVYGAYSPR